MQRAQGFQPTRQFAHKAKVRRSATYIPDLQTRGEQATRTSPWPHLSQASRRVDVERVNWPGLIGAQQRCGMFDPTPRLVKGVGQVQAQATMDKPADLTSRMYERVAGSGK